MPKFQIDMTVNFSGEVEADTEEEAYEDFIRQREYRFFDSVEDEFIQQLEDQEEEDE